MPNIVIFGASGLVGSAIRRRLQHTKNNVFYPTSKECDLLKYNEVFCYLKNKHIDYVYLCAAKVGGIIANKNYPVEFYTINTQIGLNVLKAAHEKKVKKLLYLGSTCIFPQICPQPMKEEHLLTGIVEPTNEAYALAKIGILRLCDYYNKEYGTNFISVMPTNVFGIGDNYHPQHAHAVPSMIRKIHEAKVNNIKEIVCWGDGSPVREFIYSDDLAEGLVFVMENYNNEYGFINIGTGKGETIKDLYKIVMKVLEYEGELIFDTSKPNGNPLKVCDVSKINALGWKSKISLEEGIYRTYQHLKEINFKWKEK